MHIIGSIDIKNTDRECLIILKQGGLTIPSLNLVNYVCDTFAILSTTETFLLNQSKLTSGNAVKEALSYRMECCNLTCENHKVDGQKVVISTTVNAFFNNKWKISTESVKKDNAAAFKKQKTKAIFL